MTFLIKTAKLINDDEHFCRYVLLRVFRDWPASFSFKRLFFDGGCSLLHQIFFVSTIDLTLRQRTVRVLACRSCGGGVVLWNYWYSGRLHGLRHEGIASQGRSMTLETV